MTDLEARASLLAALEAETRFLMREYGCEPHKLLNQVESIVEELRDRFPGLE